METDMENEVGRLKAERDALAAAIRDAAVKAGICRPDADLTGPMLTMLCADMGARLAELEQQKPIGWFQDVNRHNGQPPHYEHVADSHGGQDGTFQAFRVPVPATPADYTFPAGSMGAKKLEQLGGWEHWKPMGLVLHNNVESVAITEHGRVAWGDAPERPNSRLLAAARAVVARWETPLWKDAPATAGFIYELRDAIAAAAIARAEAAVAEPGACQQEPLTIRLDPNAPCRNALARDGKSYPKSNCQRCGTLLRPGWKCAEGVELGRPPMRGCELRDDAVGVFKP